MQHIKLSVENNFQFLLVSNIKTTRKLKRKKSEELYKDIMERETKSLINTWNILQFFITQENANYNASWGWILLSDMLMSGFTK